MGLQGLRKFVDGSSCTRTVVPLDPASGAVPSVHHVLIDTNSIVHSCYKKEHTTPKQTADACLDRLTALLRQVASPSTSLTICFDGPAPLAKLQTQRLRRRKVSNMDLTNNSQFSNLSITTGSLFMIELENRVARYFQRQDCPALARQVPVYVFGSTVSGEGESKISQALAFLSVLRGPGSENDTAVIFSNDIDLALTCLGATQFHNLFIVGPSSGVLISISDIIYRWIRTTSAFLSNAGQLSSARVDFVFLFLLNGGDHYIGLGEQAAELFKRYRLLRSNSPDFAIVGPDLLSADPAALAEVIGASTYEGSADADVGMRLIRAALWSLHTTVTGNCPDYRFVPESDQPTLSNVRAALKTIGSKRLSFPRKANARPLAPMATYIALMPSVETMPTAVQQVVLEDEKLQQRLLLSHDPGAIAEAATTAMERARPQLTTAEQYLCSFGKPVYVNFVAPRPKLTRRELHKAKGGSAASSQEPLTVEVVPVDLPEHFDYVAAAYSVDKLVFVDPFARQDDAATKRVVPVGETEGAVPSEAPPKKKLRKVK